MQSVETLLFVSPWLVFAFTFATACGLAEVGYRLGHRSRGDSGGAPPEGARTMVASLLALLAFFLAFTFGMAAERYDDRRALIIVEANAAATAFLRADLLEEPAATLVRESLVEYIDLRLEMVAIRTPDAIAEGVRRSEEIHQTIWSAAVRSVDAAPDAVKALAIEAINELIDLHTDRLSAALYGGIPSIIWVWLLVVSSAAMTAVGYQAGVAGPRPSLVAFLLMIAVAAVIALIADLNSPLVGMVEANQQPLREALRTMQASLQ